MDSDSPQFINIYYKEFIVLYKHDPETSELKYNKFQSGNGRVLCNNSRNFNEFAEEMFKEYINLYISGLDTEKIDITSEHKDDGSIRYSYLPTFGHICMWFSQNDIYYSSY